MTAVPVPASSSSRATVKPSRSGTGCPAAHLWPEGGDRSQGALAIERLSHHVEAGVVEHATGHAPKTGVVIDDDDGRSHAVMVALSRRRGYRADPDSGLAP